MGCRKERFQSLIGILKSKQVDATDTAMKKFQSLIGILKCYLEKDGTLEELLEFQSLIGILKF